MSRIKCPKCGSETAKILWEMPAWSEKLEKDVEDKKIYIGGCEMMIPPPSRYCFTCERGVCYAFYPVDEEETCAVEFEIGGYFGGFERIVVERDQEKYWASYYAPFSPKNPEKRITLTADEITKYLHKIYLTYIKEWDEEYVDPKIIDGTSWSISIKFFGGGERLWSGQNAYPPLWHRFLKAVNSLDLPNIK